MEPIPPLRRFSDPGWDLEKIKPQPHVDFSMLDPNVRYLWFLGRGIFWAIVFVFVLFLGIVARLADQLAIDTPFILPVAVLVLGGLAMLHLVWPFISYRHWGYALRRTDVLIRSGVIWKRLTAIPFSRIQHVDSNAGPMERSFGVANLVIHTAGSQMGTIGVPGIPAEHAEALRDYLSEVGHTHANI